jgi:hypothetical protein
MLYSKESLSTHDQNRARKDVSECEAVRCNDKATITITVPVGDKGLILVSVCKNCVGKFKRDCEKEGGAGYVEKRA